MPTVYTANLASLGGVDGSPEGRVAKLIRAGDGADIHAYCEVWKRDHRRKVEKLTGYRAHWPKVPVWTHVQYAGGGIAAPWWNVLAREAFRGRAGLVVAGREEPTRLVKDGYAWTSFARGDFAAAKGAACASYPWGHLVSTHTDAGRGVADRAARSRQLSELAGWVGRWTLPEAPLLLVGDLNCKLGDSEDERLLEAFLRWVGADLVWREEPRGMMLVAARGLAASAETVALRKERLSDHDGAVVRVG